MNLEKYIDHTLLKPEAQKKDIEKLCREAVKYDFYAVCVNSCYVSLCKKILLKSNVKIASVIGFPLGACMTDIKASEARHAVTEGADEIDMVIHIGALKDHDDEYIVRDIKSVVDAAEGKTIKVIIEACLLTEEEKIRACRLSEEAGAHFVKTSTGFSTGGADIKDIELMKKTVVNRLKVKASGGIRSKNDALAMIHAGANRIGTSSGIKIVTSN